MIDKPMSDDGWAELSAHTITQDIDAIIAENHGSPRDAINVLIARLNAARNELEILKQDRDSEERWADFYHKKLIGKSTIVTRDEFEEILDDLVKAGQNTVSSQEYGVSSRGDEAEISRLKSLAMSVYDEFNSPVF